jgi:hypothetical protein
MLAATPSPTIRQIWEPFNLHARRGVRRAPFRYWFTYIDQANAHEFRPPIERMLAWNYSVGAEIPTLRSPKDAGRMARDALLFARNRRVRAVPLSKDPIAVFSAEWLSDTFGMDTLVMIRHPAAFTASILKQGWWHPFDHFVAQPSMMRSILADHAEMIERYAREPQPLIDQAILLWVLIHDHIARMQARRPTWRFVRHEDLSTRPVAGFRDLYAWLGLQWSGSVEAAIVRSSQEGNPSVTSDASDRRRDSRSAIVAWKRMLLPEQQALVRERTDPWWRRFYEESDW